MAAVTIPPRRDAAELTSVAPADLKVGETYYVSPDEAGTWDDGDEWVPVKFSDWDPVKGIVAIFDRTFGNDGEVPSVLIHDRFIASTVKKA
jgi:hypothetical protein